jgi:hypothetical protein
MFNPIKFINPSRLFEMRPPVLHKGYAIFGIIFLVVVIIAGMVSWYLGRRLKGDIFLKKLYDKLTAFCLTSGLAGLILFAFRQWQVYFFGSRFLLLLWFIGWLTWLAYIIYFWVKIIPDRREAKDAEDLFGKYLPKKKK